MDLIRGGLLALLLADPAHALSCLRPDVVRSYLDRAERPDQVVLLGSFNFPSGALRQPDHSLTQRPAERTAEALFRGEDLRTGTRIEGTVLLRGLCWGPWCGDMAPGVHLAFARRTEQGLELQVDACGTSAFPDPDIATLARLERCMARQDCTLPDPTR
jgi:hypothetical protein